MSHCHDCQPHCAEAFASPPPPPRCGQFAALLARNSRPDTRVALGHHHRRGIVLPFAISGGASRMREFKISGRTDGCASLLDPVSSYYSGDCTNLTGILERRAVPSVSLEVPLLSYFLIPSQPPAPSPCHAPLRLSRGTPAFLLSHTHPPSSPFTLPPPSLSSRDPTLSPPSTPISPLPPSPHVGR